MTAVQHYARPRRSLRLRRSTEAARLYNSPTDDWTPLTFHEIHGDNIRLCNGNTVARRHNSFCNGLTFSARPVRVGEKVCVKFLEIAGNWSGVIRFGFTSIDPANLTSGLPRYVCPDLTNKPGYWAKGLDEIFAERDNVLFYYVTSAGDVHFGVNGEEKGVLFSGVDTSSQLWTLIDVYGKCTAIKLHDLDSQDFNNGRRSNDDNTNSHSAIMSAMQQLNIHHESNLELPDLRYQTADAIFTPLSFHPTRGRNISFSYGQCVATRTDTEYSHGYAFTERPVLLGERLLVQVLSVEPMYMGALAFGLTSCDPARLTATDLPEDSDRLLDRPEYWMVSKDVASSPQPGDEVGFTVTQSGQVLMSINGGPSRALANVDQSLQLWGFVDVFGSTQRVRLLRSREPLAAGAASPLPCSSSSPIASHVLPANLVGDIPNVRARSVAEDAAALGSPSSSSTRGEPLGSCEAVSPSSSSFSSECCSICYERNVNSALYTCGHTCMCYTCAVEQWRGKGDGKCPLCRQLIRDVIRIYRS